MNTRDVTIASAIAAIERLAAEAIQQIAVLALSGGEDPRENDDEA